MLLLFIGGCSATTQTINQTEPLQVNLTDPINIYTGDNVTNVTNVYNGSFTGWADYMDTQYNDTSRFTATAGTLVHFPNNAGMIRDTQIPEYINNSGGFYNGTHILGRTGDAYLIAISGVAEPQATNTNCEFYVTIGGSVGNLPLRLFTFPKGVGLNSDYQFSSLEYTLDTWEANGGNITIFCNNNVEFWNTSYKFAVIHKNGTNLN